MRLTSQVRQNIYAAYLDGDVTAMEALRSLCNDYEEIEEQYKAFEGFKEQTRDQMSNVLVKLGDKVEVKGFGVLTLMQPSVVEGFDKKALTELIVQLTLEGQTDLAQRLAVCRTKSARAGGLRIEREKK